MNVNSLRHNCNNESQSRTNKTVHSSKPIRKVISSKSLVQGNSCYKKGKSHSTGIINKEEKQKISKSKQTTKSDLRLYRNVRNNCRMSELCVNCGDSKETPCANEVNMKSILRNIKIDLTEGSKYSKITTNSQRPKSTTESATNYKTVKQYYINENFSGSSQSVYATNSTDRVKASLSTIKEKTEESLSDMSNLKEVLYEIYPEPTSEEMGFYDVESNENIKQIKEFRHRNYFECHSAKSRVAAKHSATDELSHHQCIYRFYLNDRLFPVPLNTDHENNIRCIDCHLPVQQKKVSLSPNGTIQAKVRLGDEMQDMILMLPVKEPLIIKERRKTLQSIVKPEVLYFGVVQLNSNGDSVFNRTTPSNSLALKYQKGYKEFVDNVNYKYDNNDTGDIIII